MTSWRRVAIGLERWRRWSRRRSGRRSPEDGPARGFDQPRGALDKAIEERFVATFQAAHPGVELKSPGRRTRRSSFRSAIQAGNAPDILQTNGPPKVVDLAGPARCAPSTTTRRSTGGPTRCCRGLPGRGGGRQALQRPPRPRGHAPLTNREALASSAPATRSLADIEAACRKAQEAKVICFETTGGKASGASGDRLPPRRGAGPRPSHRALRGESPGPPMRPTWSGTRPGSSRAGTAESST